MSLTRRTFFRTAGMGTLAARILGPNSSHTAVAQGQRLSNQTPNILFVLVDNLGYGEVGCYGGGRFRIVF